MKIVVINGSTRKNGNTEIMADAFIEGARESGNEAVKINLSETQVAPCLDCQYCFAHDGVCAQKDGMSRIWEAMEEAELVVLASPIYFSGLSAQIVAVIDRLYARCEVGFPCKYSVLLLDSGSLDQYTAAIAQYRDAIDYIKWEDQGIIAISGMEEKGSMKQAPELEAVWELGRSIR